MKRKDFTAAAASLEKALADQGTGASAARAQSHIRSVQSQIDAISKGDIESVLAQAADDVTLDIFAPPEFPWIRRTRGVAELRQALQQNFESVDDQRPEITNVVAHGNAVVLFGRERGRIRATGHPYDVEFVERFTFRDERLVSIRIIAAYVVADT